MKSHLKVNKGEKMKKLLIVLFVSLVFSSNIFSQARVNAQLAIIKDTGKELKDVLGWSKNNAGQWRSYKNQIPDHGIFIHAIYSFDKLKLYNIEYKDKKYLLFEIVIKDTGFEYPTIFEGKYNYRTSYYYIINDGDFNVSIKENKSNNSVIKAICSFKESEKWLKYFSYASISSLSEKTTPKIDKPEFIKQITYNYPYRDIELKEIELLTFYFKADNVVRFYFANEEIKTMPEDYYFECSYEHFVNFFNPTIEE